jgi:hypothetical protein
MTIIAYKDGIMAADSACWSDGYTQEVPYPKLTRSPGGSVVGMAGHLGDAWLLREWVLAGMPEDRKPDFGGTEEEQPDVMMAKGDGTLWFARGALRFSPVPQPKCIGGRAAANFVEGAIAAGASAEEAVRLAIQYHQWAGGSVQVMVVRPGECADRK